MSLHTHGPAHRARRRLVRQQVGRSRSPWEVLTAAPRIVHPLVVIADDARSLNEHAGAFRVLTKARHAVRVLHLRGRPHRAAACESDDPSAHEPAHRPSCRPSCRRDSRLSNGPTPAAGRPPARRAPAAWPDVSPAKDCGSLDGWPRSGARAPPSCRPWFWRWRRAAPGFSRAEALGLRLASTQLRGREATQTERPRAPLWTGAAYRLVRAGRRAAATQLLEDCLAATGPPRPKRGSRAPRPRRTDPRR